MLIAEVIIPLAVKGTFSYYFPADLANYAEIGQRVVIQFGKKKQYTGLIASLEEREPLPHLKEVLQIIDRQPVITKNHLELWKWIAEYYCCFLGQVMNAALPAAYKVSSESSLVMHPEFDNESDFSDDEHNVIEALRLQKKVSLNQLQIVLGKRHLYPSLKALTSKKIALLEEEIEEKYRPKLEKFVHLNERFVQESGQEDLETLNKNAPVQKKIVESFYELSPQNKALSQNKLLQKTKLARSALMALIKKGIFVQRVQQVSRIASDEHISIQRNELSAVQRQCLKQLKNELSSKTVALLFGITASGKTHIYIELIKEILQSEGQVLFLLPEIALTAEMTSRLKAAFGTAVGVYHSRFNEMERVEIWQKVKTGEIRLIVGARSAVLLPFERLKLVIVDEEHDYSYKQQDPAPRYNARDVAIYAATLYSAKVVLGSATPSFESFYKAKNGKYGYAELLHKHSSGTNPALSLIDLRNRSVRKNMKSHFGRGLIEDIRATLTEGKQVIVFRNKRGYAPYLSCSNCQWAAECKNCSIRLTYYKYEHYLKCNYCGFRERLTAQCPSCGLGQLRIEGFGTEKIEDELRVFFPEAKVQRFDADTTRKKKAHERILDKFKRREIDILVGTQMLSKGLDFDNVGLVGVTGTDQMFFFNDFRSYERSFQTLMQLSGRAGRKEGAAKVVIQTSMPEHFVFNLLKKRDYPAFFNNMIGERSLFGYPPFSRIIEIIIKHKEESRSLEMASKLSARIKKIERLNVLGPADYYPKRLNNFYIKTLLIKLGSGSNNKKIKQFIQLQVELLQQMKRLRSVRVAMNVDPL